MTDKTPSPTKKISPDWFLQGALTRIGDTLDRFTGRRWAPSSTLATSELVERLKRLLDSEARDIPGKGCVVPHNLRLLVQWDKFSTDGESALKKLEDELLTAAADHINDRLYYTMSPLKLEVKPDYFVDGVKLSASFESFADVQHEAELAVTLPSINLAGTIPEVAAAPAAGAKYVLVARFVLGGVPRDRRIEVKSGDRISVGRTASNQLPIDNVSVSKSHASIVVGAAGELAVADTGSTNGTFVRSERIAYGKAVSFEPSDRVRFGDVEVVFDHVETVREVPSEVPAEQPGSGSVEVDGMRFSSRDTERDPGEVSLVDDMAATLRDKSGPNDIPGPSKG